SRGAPANPNHRLEQARPFTRRTSTRLEQLVLAEHEVARLAAGRHDLDVVTRRARGPQRVAKVVFDVAAGHAELARERRYGSKFVGEQIDQLPAERHPFTRRTTSPSA